MTLKWVLGIAALVFVATAIVAVRLLDVDNSPAYVLAAATAIFCSLVPTTAAVLSRRKAERRSERSADTVIIRDDGDAPNSPQRGGAVLEAPVPNGETDRVSR